MIDVFGRAILDFQKDNYTEDIITFSSLDEEDVIPVPYLFRNFKETPKLEQEALQLCKGLVLDVGCGAGSHSLYLQEKGLDVTALDYSEGATKTCKLRGLQNVVYSDIYSFKDQKFDTLLLLMNGIGIVGKLNHMSKFLEHLKTLMNPGAQILLDSSDIIYMFEEDEDGGVWVPDTGSYYGEIEFQMKYKDQKSDSFFWLYLDYNTLEKAAEANGFNCKLVRNGEHYDYLAKLWLK
ncbi:bifunctional 2-polyprenyl-6-hydroxyphenol methylase/3-demethylubiquinol 3-O-methyltransferase UbiG [Zobellia sp. 1_MG-2023]|uniref:class I SAM-dependent methyltransferase n=1 Tax=Zobellia sp. 1_MG-2023 TaxID=3062626 RepID=UPI0026E3E01E|nr:class I SAM-dependent methyltransferase [Zobellia sp. 1_MG-2023]MDO6818820.1 class I SAM-dependent methyltransferase [Zobellia sp. 1_MG-2023]